MNNKKPMINATRALLLKISKELGNKELTDMKFLCHGCLPDGYLQNITTFTELFKQIHQHVDPDEYGKSFISELLINIGRKDLSNELLGILNDEKPQKPNEEMKYLLQVGKMVAADWRQLGRHLGLENYKIEEIDADKKGVQEKCAEVLAIWTRSKDANKETLKEKLLEMGRRDVVNAIEREQEDVPASSNEKSNYNPGNVDHKATTHTKYNIETDSKVVYSQQKPNVGGLSSKYNINVHPGSHVMVGDCGSMTIYASANVDHKTLKMVQHNTSSVRKTQEEKGPDEFVSLPGDAAPKK